MQEIAELLFEELKRANCIYGTSFASPHEGYAVMKEEFDKLWAEVTKKNPDKTRKREEATEEAKCRTCLFLEMTINHQNALGEDPCDHCYRSSRWVRK